MSARYAYYNDNEPLVASWLGKLISRGLIMDGVVDTRPIQEVEPDDLRGFVRHHFFAGIGGWDYALQLAGWPEEPPVVMGEIYYQPGSLKVWVGVRGIAPDASTGPLVWKLIGDASGITPGGDLIINEDPSYEDIATKPRGAVFDSQAGHIYVPNG